MTTKFAVIRAGTIDRMYNSEDFANRMRFGGEVREVAPMPVVDGVQPDTGLRFNHRSLVNGGGISWATLYDRTECTDEELDANQGLSATLREQLGTHRYMLYSRGERIHGLTADSTDDLLGLAALLVVDDPLCHQTAKVGPNVWVGSDIHDPE